MLDIRMIRANDSITTDIYRKATLTDQYLQWASNHPVHQKLGIVRTLMHHAETLIKDEARVKIEKEKVRVALRNCGYPDWTLKEGEQLGKRKKRREEDMQEQDGEIRLEEPKKAFEVLPYMKGVTARLQRAYKQHNIQLICKARYTWKCSCTPEGPFGPGGKMWCGI